MIGRIMGSALRDGFIFPLPLSTEIFSLLKGEDLQNSPRPPMHLVEGANGYMAGLHMTCKEAAAESASGNSSDIFRLEGASLRSKFGDDFFTVTAQGVLSVRDWL